MESSSIMSSPSFKPKKLTFNTPVPSFKTLQGKIFTFNRLLKDSKKLHLVGDYELYVGEKGSEIFGSDENEEISKLFHVEMSKIDEKPQKKKKKKPQKKKKKSKPDSMEICDEEESSDQEYDSSDEGDQEMNDEIDDMEQDVDKVKQDIDEANVVGDQNFINIEDPNVVDSDGKWHQRLQSIYDFEKTSDFADKKKCKDIAKKCVNLIKSCHLTKASIISRIPEAAIRARVAGVLKCVLQKIVGGSIWDEKPLDILIDLCGPPLLSKFLSAVSRLNGLSTVTTIIPLSNGLFGSLTPGAYLSLDYQWTLNTNTFCCIIGPSGAGKTWYLRAITELGSHADTFLNEWFKENDYKFEVRHVIDGSFSSSSFIKQIATRKGRAFWVTDEMGAFYKVVMSDNGSKTMSGSESVGNLIKIYNGDDVMRSFNEDSYNAAVKKPCVSIAFTSQTDSTKDLEPLLKSGLIPRFQLGFYLNN